MVEGDEYDLSVQKYKLVLFMCINSVTRHICGSSCFTFGQELCNFGGINQLDTSTVRIISRSFWFFETFVILIILHHNFFLEVSYICQYVICMTK